MTHKSPPGWARVSLTGGISECGGLGRSPLGAQPEVEGLEQPRPLPLLPVAPLLRGSWGGLGWRGSLLEEWLEEGLRELTPGRRGPARPLVPGLQALPLDFLRGCGKAA